MNAHPLVIDTDEKLLAICRSESLLHPFRKPMFKLRLPSISTADNLFWESRLDALRHECGGASPASALILFTLASLAWVVVSAAEHPSGAAGRLSLHAFLLDIGMFSAGLVSSAMVGKVAGLSLAALRFRRTCRALLAPTCGGVRQAGLHTQSRLIR